MTALDLLEIKELYNFPLHIHLDKGIMLYEFDGELVVIAEDVGGGEYETLTLARSSVYSSKYMRVGLKDYNIIKAIFRGKK